MSFNAATDCLLPTDLPSPLGSGPHCSVYAPNPNASFAQRISNCCKGAQVRYVGNSTTEVPMDRSCISFCSYPDFQGDYAQRSQVNLQWRKCLGVDLGNGAQCQNEASTTTGSNSGNSSTPQGAAARGPLPLLGGRGGAASALVLATLVAFPWAVSVVVVG
ncbi:hypothetical protein OC844_002668 [Tilletia horrida]|nr:hypothetical protein OC844_002668 [Tilletia horrida]